MCETIETYGDPARTPATGLAAARFIVLPDALKEHQPHG